MPCLSHLLNFEKIEIYVFYIKIVKLVVVLNIKSNSGIYTAVDINYILMFVKVHF